MAAYLLEPTTAPTSTPDYGGSITGIRSELTSIDTDTTAIAANISAMTTNSTAIAASIATIATNSTNISTKISTISDKITIIADKQTLMETYQKKLKELAEDKGIRIVSPWEYLTLILQYKSLIEEGNILKEPTIQKSATKEARAKIDDYIRSIGDLPREF
jgi:hypothetical protein